MKTTLNTFRGLAAATLLIAAVSARSVAQTGTVGTQEGDKTTLDQNVYGLGMNFSLLSGMGLSFKQHFAQSRFSYMLTGYVYKDNSGSTYDYGVELQYDIYLKQATRFYTFVGMSYFYNGSPITTFDQTTGTNQTSMQNQLDGPQRLGGGVGFESTMSSSVCFYANISLTSFQPSGDLSIYPYAGFMIYFK